MQERYGNEVLIFGGSVVGRALELLLRGTDLSVRFLEDFSSEDPRLLDGARLVLIAPGIDAEKRGSLVRLARSKAHVQRVPILELTSGESSEAAEDGHTMLLWPCPVETVRQWVQDLLYPERPGNGHSTAPAP